MSTWLAGLIRIDSIISYILYKKQENGLLSRIIHFLHIANILLKSYDKPIIYWESKFILFSDQYEWDTNLNI